MHYTATLFMIACYIGYRTFFAQDISSGEWFNRQGEQVEQEYDGEPERTTTATQKKGAYVCSQSLPYHTSIDTMVQTAPLIRKSKVMHVDDSFLSEQEHPKSKDVSQPVTAPSKQPTPSSEEDTNPFMQFLYKLQRVFQYSTGLVTTVS